MDLLKFGTLAKLSVKCTKCCPLELIIVQKKNFFTKSSNSAKFFDSNRQGKIFSKFYGERIAGRKRRWFPTQETTMNSTLNLNPISIGKPIKNSGGKGNLRRIAVLNKLFMQHITDLLATGEASEHVLNRGLQITRVKISVDFTNINVYWLGSGSSAAADTELEQELRRTSGLLRHELSQLELMGSVPRIHFVRDRTNANLLQITEMLNKIEPELIRDETETQTDEVERFEPTGKLQKEAKKEFFGANADTQMQEKSQLPQMRQDVFGLDHEQILMKILTKMRKSKQAWNAHNRTLQSNQETVIKEEK